MNIKEGQFRDILAEKGRLVLTAEGVSMLPCIRSKKDVLVLVSPDESIRLYQVILYQRKNGAFVLHRIMGVKESGYVLCGDNQYQKEYGIQKNQILGVLEGFYRGEQYVDCENSRGYQRYVKIWCASLLLRRIPVWVMKVISRIKRGRRMKRA